ncbi:MAG TPA: ABC transporter ATP-binding protein [Candidatus Pacearchaeota archaeon]|nr:ABC transporter ATP-binding protein [Candidatus Pacearchaeota archaeon]HOL90464.1 ABC transporter ATP-binding protein [Candidatus Pacearchaeota archaeon]
MSGTKILKYFTPYIWPFILMVIFIFFQSSATLTLPNYMAKIINEGIISKNTEVIFRSGLIMIFVAIVGSLAAVFVGYLSSRIGTGFARNLREAVFTKVENFSLVEFDKFLTSSLITRITNDIQQIQMVLIMLFRIALMAPLMGVLATFKAYQLVSSMTWIMAVAVIVLISIIIVLFKIVTPKFDRLQKLIDKLNLVTREILTGLRVIRAFNKEEYEEKKFNEVNEDLTRLNLFINRLMMLLQPAMMLIMNFMMITIVWFGAHQIELGNLQVGNMLAFLQYSIQAVSAFLMISIIFIAIPRASVSIGRIVEILETDVQIKDPINPVRVPRRGGKVEFKNVTFTYPGAAEPVLYNISFVAFPGQTTAFVGSTGSGKSTIINLIPRFYDATEGQVLVDEVDVRDMKQSDLRSRIGYVSQKAMLFSGTIKENIAYGNPNATQEEIFRAAATAQALEFIKELEQKFDSSVSQAGSNFSGGQKQRLAIARALAKNPELYLFDDSFSALDFKTDAALRNALKKETQGKTVIIVTQRISTVIDADKIIVIDAGRIVGEGTHKELLRTCSIYKEIAASQLSPEELARDLK